MRDHRDFRDRQSRRWDWNTYRPGLRPPQWGDHRRDFDMRRYQDNRRALHRYRWGTYHRPHGWYYQRWAYGQIFPRFFWARDYWITSYWLYDLMDPPYGYVWVRYGDDAVLVNVETGAILRVEYGAFY